MSTYLCFYLLLAAALGFNVMALKVPHRRWMVWAVHSISVSGMAAYMWVVSDPPTLFSDFTQAYYPAGRGIVEDPSRLYTRVPECAEEAICGYVNLPLLAVMFTPLSFFTLSTAHFVVGVVSALCVAATLSCAFSLSQASGWTKVAIIWLFVINGPLYYSVREGNLTHVVLLLLFAASMQMEKRQDVRSGVLLALAAIIKLPLMLLGLYFLLRRRWHVVAGFGAAVLVMVGVSLLWFGFDVHATWHRESIQPFAGKALGAFNVQSVDGFLMRLRDDVDLYGWKPSDVGWKFKVLRYAVVSALLGGTLWICRRAARTDCLPAQHSEFSIVLCLTLLVSPISWSHYYLFLLLPLCLYVGNKLEVRAQGMWRCLVVVGTLLISPPVVFIHPDHSILGPWVTKVLMSHYFFGAFILLVVLLAARWQKSNLI